MLRPLGQAGQVDVTPEVRGEPVVWHGHPAGQREPDQQNPLQRTVDGDRGAAEPDCQRTEDKHL